MLYFPQFRSHQETKMAARELNDRHLWSHGKIRDCERSNLKLVLVSTCIPVCILIQIYVCTLTAIDFYCHWYVFVPLYRQYPDEVCCDRLTEFIVHNRDSVSISAKHLHMKKQKKKLKYECERKSFLNTQKILVYFSRNVPWLLIKMEHESIITIL